MFRALLLSTAISLWLLNSAQSAADTPNSTQSPVKESQNYEEHSAHEHGVASLALTISGATVAVLLDSPSVNVYGFEHTPQSQAEKEIVDKVATQLQNGSELFSFDEAASCQLSQAGFKPEGTKPTESAQSEHEPSHEQDVGEHSDIEYLWSFQCAHPEALKSITPKLFSTFSGLHQVTLQWVTEQGASAFQLESDMTVSLYP